MQKSTKVLNEIVCKKQQETRRESKELGNETCLEGSSELGREKTQVKGNISKSMQDRQLGTKQKQGIKRLRNYTRMHANSSKE